MSIESDPPGDDELEVTLLGRGIGESCVLHVGQGRWVVIDSFGPRRPAAREYLDRIGVDSNAVEAIVVTHPHRDHYKGIDLLVDHYRRARLMMSEPLHTHTLLALYNQNSASPVLGELPVAMRVAERRIIPGHGVTRALASLSAGVMIIDEPGLTLRALSPVEAARIDGLRHIALKIRDGESIKVRTALNDQNLWSVVLHLSVGDDRSVLLTGDMVEHQEYGWTAVLDEPRNETAKRSLASFVKVPHHGSANAHSDSMWRELTTGDRVLAVSPYWGSRIPTPADIQRLTGYGPVWQSAPAVSFTVDEFGNQISLPIETGIVQARRAPTDTAWRVSVEPPAFLASTH